VSKLIIGMGQLMVSLCCAAKLKLLIIFSSLVGLQSLCEVGLELSLTLLGTLHPLRTSFILFHLFLIATGGMFGFYLLLRVGRSGISVIKLLWNILFLTNRLIACSKLSYFCSNGGPCSKVRTWRLWRFWRTCFTNFTTTLAQLQGPSFFVCTLSF
jgi:hypothetical protein